MLFLGKHKNSSFLCRIRINLSLHVGISQAVEIAAPSQDVACVNYPLESDVAGDNSEGSWDNAPALSHSPPRLAGNRGRGMLRSRGWIQGRSQHPSPGSSQDRGGCDPCSRSDNGMRTFLTIPRRTCVHLEKTAAAPSQKPFKEENNFLFLIKASSIS